MKIYISGPMKGVADYINKFNAIEIELLNKGYEVVNPCSVCRSLPIDTKYIEYMRYDIRALTFCDAIYMMKGWENSTGTKIELNVAQAIGLKVLYE